MGMNIRKKDIQSNSTNSTNDGKQLF